MTAAVEARAWGVLCALPRAREVRPGQWAASCPTDRHPHGDRSAGLRLALSEGGAVLLSCYAGCDPRDVLAAVGLRLRDCYPDTPARRRAQRVAADAMDAPVDPTLVAAIEAERASWRDACRVVGREVATAVVGSIARQRRERRVEVLV